MSSLSANVEIVAAFYGADDAQRLALLDPDVEWIQNEGFPGGGHYHSADDVRQGVFGEIRRQWSTWETELDELLDAGDTVVAIGAYRATAKTTGTSVRAAFAHVFTIAGGRVVRLRQFTDTALLVRALTLPDLI